MLKAVIIGTSGHFPYAVRAVKKGAPCVITAIAPGQNESINRDRIDLPDIKVYSDYVEMLDAESPDIVIVNPEFHKISRCAVAAASRGINAFVRSRFYHLGWSGGSRAGCITKQYQTMYYDGYAS